MARQFNPYSTAAEINLRQEFINTMTGTFFEISKGQTFVLRKMRTSNGELIQCPCVDLTTGEYDKSTYCPICLNSGYLWDESFITGYKKVLDWGISGATKEALIGPGNVNLVYASFYFKYNIGLNLLPKRKSPDRIIEIALDSAGNPIRPYQRKTIYRIGTIIEYRADNAKIEYYKLDCYEEQVKFLNGQNG